MSIIMFNNIRAADLYLDLQMHLTAPRQLPECVTPQLALHHLAMMVDIQGTLTQSFGQAPVLHAFSQGGTLRARQDGSACGLPCHGNAQLDSRGSILSRSAVLLSSCHSSCLGAGMVGRGRQGGGAAAVSQLCQHATRGIQLFNADASAHLPKALESAILLGVLLGAHGLQL